LTLKQILELYLEMKHREEQRDKLMKELTQTNTLLRQVISLYHPQIAQGSVPTLDIAPNSQPSPATSYHEALIPGAVPHSREVAAELPPEATPQEGSIYEDENGQLYTIEPEPDPLAEAYQRMLSDPVIADRLAQQLNQVINSRQSSRQGTQAKHDANRNVMDDSMYEQVLDSAAMAELIDQMLPHSDPTTSPWDPSQQHNEHSQDHVQELEMMTPSSEGGIVEVNQIQHSTSHHRHMTSQHHREQLASSAPSSIGLHVTSPSPVAEYEGNPPSPTRRPRKRFNITSQMGPGPIADQVVSSPLMIPPVHSDSYFHSIPLPGGDESAHQPALPDMASTSHQPTSYQASSSRSHATHHHPQHNHSSHHKIKSPTHAKPSSSISPPPRSSHASQNGKSSRGADSSTPIAKRRKS
jgi:hypothetical protein